MADRDKKQSNLDCLYQLAESDSDSIRGFIELNGVLVVLHFQFVSFGGA